MNFVNFFYVFKNTFLKKNRVHNRATVSSITEKLFVCDVEFSYISKIRNVAFIFQNFPKDF